MDTNDKPAVGSNAELGRAHSAHIDFAEAVNQLTDHLEVSSWVIRGFVSHPDLAGFQRQDTEMTLFPVEYVKQRGSDEYGFSGTILLPTGYSNGDGGSMHLHIDFYD